MMITTITDNEVNELINLTNKLIEACSKNKEVTEREIKDMEDLVYYFKKAFDKGDIDLTCMNTVKYDHMDDDDEDW